MLRRLLVAALAAAAILPMNSAPATAHRVSTAGAGTTTPARGCVPGDCFTVGAVLDRAPAVGQHATLRIEVTAKAAAGPARVVADLPANLRWVTPPEGLTRARATIGRSAVDRATRTVKLREHQRLTFTGTVTAVAPGPAPIRVHVSDGRPGPGEQALAYITVGTESSTLGMPRSPRPAPPDPATQYMPSTAPAAGDTACVNGTISHVTAEGQPEGRVEGVSQLSLVARDRDADGGDDVLARGVTQQGGFYQLCFPADDTDESGGQDVYVTGETVNPYWTVTDPRSGQPYTFVTPVTENVPAGDYRVIDHLAGPTTPQEGAFRVHAAAYATWKAYTGWTGQAAGGCWIPGRQPCRTAKVVWAPDIVVDRAYYCPAAAGQDCPEADVVHLSERHQLEKMTVAHELGHFIMDYAYADAWPQSPSACPVPHFVTMVSSPVCAWTEGWADWVAVQAFDDTHRRWSPLDEPVDVESPTRDTPDWPDPMDGESVEGRITALLLDLADSGTRNEPIWDVAGEGPARAVSVVTASRPADVDAFRAALDAALPTAERKYAAEATGYHNTMSMALQEPITDRAELSRPSGSGLSYGYTTARPTWSVVASLHTGAAGGDVNLALSRADHSVLRVESKQSDRSRPDFIAVHSPTPTAYSAYVWGQPDTQQHRVEFAESTGTLEKGVPAQLRMEAGDVVEIRTADLTQGVPATFTVTPLNGQDYDILVVPPGTAWATPRSGSIGWTRTEPGRPEGVTVTNPKVTGTYAVIVLQKSGSGDLKITRS
ncbi:hypothetical protein HII36_09545 [Nonomuraea sp. NN258]|uniref:hypothetical protein n=1 Tax=Nonomuraea antri TaxID=2730852 RepID=UPI001569315E|nr:hypothetical protein [Nonomuraea antri]NRQ32080.1 hypothetical protein [Nonomuraea antri]